MYSAFRSEDTEVLVAGGLSDFEQMGFQVAFESENVFAQSNVSRYRVLGGWISNRESATGQFSVYARNDQQRSIGRAQSSR